MIKKKKNPTTRTNQKQRIQKILDCDFVWLFFLLSFKELYKLEWTYWKKNYVSELREQPDKASNRNYSTKEVSFFWFSHLINFSIKEKEKEKNKKVKSISQKFNTLTFNLTLLLPTIRPHTIHSSIYPSIQSDFFDFVFPLEFFFQIFIFSILFF